MAKITVRAKRNGKTITYKTKDRGKPGKTPESEQWFEPSKETGWKKDMAANKRRRLVLKSHKGDLLASARAMQALANVTTDRETEDKAKTDANYFYAKYRKQS